MLNVIVSGCNGKMGQVLVSLIEKEPDMIITAGIDISGKQMNSFPVYSKPDMCKEKTDVIIDFSNADFVNKLLDFAVSRKIPIVIATTGLSNSQSTKINHASLFIPIFQTGNMSIGVNLVQDLVQKTASILYKDFDIEIIEKHHNQKIDAPSGTALMLANSVSSAILHKSEYIYKRADVRKKREKNEIGIHSLRGGTIVGEHTVVFAGPDEIIEIKHSALSRNIFGMGAIRAAKFLATQNPGFYNMKNIIK